MLIRPLWYVHKKQLALTSRAIRVRNGLETIVYLHL